MVSAPGLKRGPDTGEVEGDGVSAGPLRNVLVWRFT
jgi:hypothetical protein